MDTRETDVKQILEEAHRVLREEAYALSSLKLGEDFSKAIEALYGVLFRGNKIILSGVGKSGDVARKVAATLRSTGSMAVYVHPVEVLHGDLGLFSPKDAFLYFSNSGSTMEILELCSIFPNWDLTVVGVLGNKEGKLSKHTPYVIEAPVLREACPHNLAPTTSSTLQMAIGDAIAVCLQKLTGFNPEHYGKLHPGGALGKRLHARVKDIMYSKEEISLLPGKTCMEEVLISMTEKRMGGVCVVEESGKLIGVITERDMRQAVLKKETFFKLQAKDIMTKNPVTTSPDTKVREALELTQNRPHPVSFLPVVDDKGICLGTLRIHDLILGGLS